MNIHIILGLCFLYFLVILAFVVYARYRATKCFLPDINEFFLASKSLSPLVLTCTYVASLFSTFSILGLPILMYAHGISGLFFIFITDLIGLTILVYVGKRLYRYAQGEKIFSPIEAISKAYNSRVLGTVLAGIFVIALLPYIALQLVGIGAFMESYSEGRINYLTGVGSMMAIVLIYLFLGGMRAVAYTDFVQLFAMLIGLLFGAVYLCNHYDINLATMFGDLKSSSPLHFMPPGAKDHFYWPMIISTAIVTAGIFVQPHLLTRALMAKEEKHINTMVIGTVIGRIITVALAIFIGAFAYTTYGSDLKPNLIMGEIFRDLGTLGFIGLILSVIMLMGALGAAMSTADSLLISIGQISTRDILRPYFKMTHKRQVLISKGIMVVILLFSFVIGLNPPQYMTDLAIYSGAISAVLIPTFLSFMWGKKSIIAAYISIGLGGGSLLVLTLLKLTDQAVFTSVHIGLIPVVLSFVGYYGTALLVKRTPADPLSHAQE